MIDTLRTHYSGEKARVKHWWHLQFHYKHILIYVNNIYSYTPSTTYKPKWLLKLATYVWGHLVSVCITTSITSRSCALWSTMISACEDHLFLVSFTSESTFYSYSKERWTRLIFNGHTTDWILSLIGVPQGSIIACLLFIFYINEMTKVFF